MHRLIAVAASLLVMACGGTRGATGPAPATCGGAGQACCAVGSTCRDGLSCQLGACQVPPVGTFGISGRISGVGTAAVTVALSGPVTASAVTDPGGSYRFVGLAAGTYLVTPSLASFIVTPPSRPVVLTDADVGAQDFSAERCGSQGTACCSGGTCGAGLACQAGICDAGGGSPTALKWDVGTWDATTWQ